MKNTLKYGLTAIVGAYLISTLVSSPAIAATITGTIKVEIIGGFGSVYTGDFSYDDSKLTKVGSEFMTINGGTGIRDRAGLLSLNFKFLDFATGLIPVTYTARDDANFPDGPILVFENGVPTEFFFLVDPDKNGGIFGPNNGIGFLDSKSFRFGLRNGSAGGTGSVTLEVDKPTPVEPPSVPENSSPFVSLLAALGLGAAYLRRKPRKVNN